MKAALFVALVLIGATTAPAQEVRRLTPEQAVEVGLQNSHALGAVRQDAAEASARYAEVRTMRLPVFSAQAGYQRLSSNIPDFEAGMPAPGGGSVTLFSIPAVLDRYSSALTIQQPLFTGFRIQNSIRAAGYQAEAAGQNVATAEADLALQIQEAYWNVYKASALQGIVTEALRLVNALMQDVLNMEKAGLATRSDVLAVETRRAEVILQQVEAENALRMTRLSLNYVTGLPLETVVDPAVTPAVTVEEENADSLIARAVTRRTELGALESQIQALEAGIRMARAGNLPRVAAVGNYRYARPNPMFFPPKDEFDWSWDAGLSVSMDLWNWGRTRAQTEQARARLEKGREQLALLSDAIRMDVSRRILEVRRAREVLDAIDQRARSSEEFWRVVRDRYNQGMARNSEVLEAEVAFRNAQIDRSRALADLETARAALRRATGERP